LSQRRSSRGTIRDKELIRLRAARRSDFSKLRQIHIASRAPFVEVHRTEFSRLPSVSDEMLEQCVGEEGLLVAVGRYGPVGFGLCERLGPGCHLQQLSVLPERARRGIGSAILDGLLELSLERGDAAMTLITYADIAWNRPFYARRGFRVVARERAPEHLLRLLDEERGLGIDISRRVVMERILNKELQG
jgi:GNAT superfamily N-acetyltransferase